MTTCDTRAQRASLFFFLFFKFSHSSFPPSSHNHLDLQSNKDDSVGLEDGCADSFHTRMREDSPPDEQRGRFAKIYIDVRLCFHFRLFMFQKKMFLLIERCWKTEIVFACFSELILYKTETQIDPMPTNHTGYSIENFSSYTPMYHSLCQTPATCIGASLQFLCIKKKQTATLKKL